MKKYFIQNGSTFRMSAVIGKKGQKHHVSVIQEHGSYLDNAWCETHLLEEVCVSLELRARYHVSDPVDILKRIGFEECAD